MPAVAFHDVDVIFGKDPGPALKLLDAGAERQAILERTGNVLGVAGASVAIEEGEICVLMGLSGSGKSTLLRCVNGLCKATRGRVLVRYSGTEAKARVMVEGDDDVRVRQYAEELAAELQRSLAGSA